MRAGWDFWWRWVVASALGPAAGWGVASTLYVLLGLTEELVTSAPARIALFATDGVALGVGLGSAQLLVLRRRLDRSSGWVWAITLSYGIGFAMTGVLEQSFSEAIGAFTGYALTALMGGVVPWLLVLRRRVSRSGWWVAASGLGFYTGVFAAVGAAPLVASALGMAKPGNLGQSSAGVAYAVIIAAVIGLVLGFATATALVVLLRRRVTQS